MAILNDAVIHGKVQANEQYLLSEQKKNLATIEEGTMKIGDSSMNEEYSGKNVYMKSAEHMELESNGDIKLNAKCGLVLNAKALILNKFMYGTDDPNDPTTMSYLQGLIGGPIPEGMIYFKLIK